MANYQDKITIDTTVNGKQAEDELKRLRQQAIELKEKNCRSVQGARQISSIRATQQRFCEN